VALDGSTIRTPRLVVRPWSPSDAPEALTFFGDVSVTRWLSPAMDRVTSVEEMAATISGWLEEAPAAPAGRWAVTSSADGQLLGGVSVLPLPPEHADLAIGWQLNPAVWGLGYAAEAGHAVAHHAFEAGVDELFAVVRPRNTRGARTATSIGMEWVGETEKYYDLRLQVYRLRKGELDVPQLPRS
jgi:RimJ/RimL family protein N-acetyltransferase